MINLGYIGGVRLSLSTPDALFCCSFLQGEKKNPDVFVQQFDGIAGVLPEALLAACRLIVPYASVMLSFMERSGH
jgi:hypothetical protein